MVWEIVINLLPTTSRAVDRNLSHQTYLTVAHLAELDHLLGLKLLIGV